MSAFTPEALLGLVTSPAAWAAFVTLVVLEVVLGVDNLIFISILSNRLPEQSRARTRSIGLIFALLLRLLLLSTLAFLTRLTRPVVSGFGFDFSWRDIILIGGGLFLVWKATTEIHEAVAPEPEGEHHAERSKHPLGFASAIVQILFLDMVFSFDSILTAVGMTDHLPIMMAAVIISVGLMMVAAGPLGAFIRKNPTVVMLALGFLLVVGAALIADGFGVHVPKGYIYAAMAFSALVEGLNMAARRKRRTVRPRPAESGEGTT